MSTKTKKYYWLKQSINFFQDPKIKKLRRIAGGDTYTIIYQKMMLLSVPTDGIIIFERIEDTFVDELALILDEDEANISVTINYMVAKGLLEEIEANKFLLPTVPYHIGSEGTSAERVREHRKRKKEVLLQSNNDVTEVKQLSNTEIETEINKEKEIKIETHTNNGLLNLWLSEKSKNAKSPIAYKLTMEKLFEEGNPDVVEEYSNWLDQKKCMEQEAAIRKEEIEKAHLINSFNYKPLIGLYVKGKCVIDVFNNHELSTINIKYTNNQDETLSKCSLYDFLQEHENV